MSHSPNDGTQEPATRADAVIERVLSRAGTAVAEGETAITDYDGEQLEREERAALQRVSGLSTELEDITEVEYRQLRLEKVVLVGQWARGPALDAEISLRELAALAGLQSQQNGQTTAWRRWAVVIIVGPIIEHGSFNATPCHGLCVVPAATKPARIDRNVASDRSDPTCRGSHRPRSLPALPEREAIVAARHTVARVAPALISRQDLPSGLLDQKID